MKAPKPSAYQQALARQRAQLIIQVRSGLLSAQEAARQLGISRKTYYQWEHRALAAMIEALGNRGHGRPPRPTIWRRRRSNARPRSSRRSFKSWSRQSGFVRPWSSLTKKKHEVAEIVVTTLTRLKQQVGWPYQRLTESLGLPYASFRRWKHRLAYGQPGFSKPGPKKVTPLNLDELRGHLCRLEHGRERSRGVGELYRLYQSQISRRDLEVLTETVRRELHQQHQAELRHITWHVPGPVWSLDDAELARLADHKLRLHQVQDLASRYKFTPLVGGPVLGESVALHLEQLFLQHGPPLMLKRDNGSNLNHQAVDEVLARYLVIPLNSPPHYPPYNGGMECAVREVKTPLVEKILADRPVTASQLQVWAEVLAHELNHRSRPCLQGKVACEVFHQAKRALKTYTLRKRKETLEWINELTSLLIQVWDACTPRQAETARRLAVETWLQRNGVITVSQNPKVLPVFSEKTAQRERGHRSSLPW